MRDRRSRRRKCRRSPPIPGPRPRPGLRPPMRGCRRFVPEPGHRASRSSRLHHGFAPARDDRRSCLDRSRARGRSARRPPRARFASSQAGAEAMVARDRPERRPFGEFPRGRGLRSRGSFASAGFRPGRRDDGRSARPSVRVPGSMSRALRTVPPGPVPGPRWSGASPTGLQGSNAGHRDPRKVRRAPRY